MYTARGLTYRPLAALKLLDADQKPNAIKPGRQDFPAEVRAALATKEKEKPMSKTKTKTATEIKAKTKTKTKAGRKHISSSRNWDIDELAFAIRMYQEGYSGAEISEVLKHFGCDYRTGDAITSTIGYVARRRNSPSNTHAERAELLGLTEVQKIVDIKANNYPFIKLRKGTRAAKLWRRFNDERPLLKKRKAQPAPKVQPEVQPKAKPKQTPRLKSTVEAVAKKLVLEAVSLGLPVGELMLSDGQRDVVYSFGSSTDGKVWVEVREMLKTE